MLKVSVQSDIAKVRLQFAGKQRQINLAASRALNRAITSVRSVATKELSKATGIRPQSAVRERLPIRKASPNKLIAEVGVEAYTPNLARFTARETRRGLSAAAWNKRKVYPRVFLGNQGRTAFKRVGKARLPIKAVHGPRLHKAFIDKAVVKAMSAVAQERFRTEFRREVKRRTGA